MAMFGIEASRVYCAVIGIPSIIKTYFLFLKQKDINFKKVKYKIILEDIRKPAGDVPMHYFHQDLLVSKLIYKKRPKEHVDVASRLDGFIAHLLVFMPVKMVDVRPLDNNVEGLEFIQGLGEDMSFFKDGSIESLSCLHAIEHFGLGRFGDPVDLDAIYKAAEEFKRVLSKSGRLYVSMPVSSENTIFFNGARIFNPDFVINTLFQGLSLKEMHGVSDENTLLMNIDCDTLKQQEYGCGIFVFGK